MSPAAPSGLSRSPRRFRRQIDELHDLVRAAALHGSDADALAQACAVSRGTPDWVAKLDTVIHELYHIDPEQNCLRRFARADGSVSDALHNPTYFEDVAQLRSIRPAIQTRNWWSFSDDFDVLRTRYGGVAGVTFRAFLRIRAVIARPSQACRCPSTFRTPLLRGSSILPDACLPTTICNSANSLVIRHGCSKVTLPRSRLSPQWPVSD